MKNATIITLDEPALDLVRAAIERRIESGKIDGRTDGDRASFVAERAGPEVLGSATWTALDGWSFAQINEHALRRVITHRELAAFEEYPCDDAFEGDEHDTHAHTEGQFTYRCKGDAARRTDYDGPDNDDWIHDAYLRQHGLQDVDERLRR